MSSTDPLRVTRDLLTQRRAASTRRTALRTGALALAVLGTTACDASGGDRDAPPPTTSASGTAADEAADDEVADTQLAAEALGHLDATLALVTAVTTRHPATEPFVDGLVRAQAAHRALLAEAAPEAETPQTLTSPPGEARAWSALRRREEALQAELGTLALRAGSGPFARLLAVMAASVAQHLAALPATLPRAPGSAA